MSKLQLIASPSKDEPLYVACSGGSDSLALLHLCVKKGYKPCMWYFNHADEIAEEEEAFCVEHSKLFSIPIHIDRYKGAPKPLRKSPKEFYRDMRYEALQKLQGHVMIGHNLDDVVEGYLFSFLRNGEGYFIPYKRDNATRPLLLSTKQEGIDFLVKNQITWFEDPTNKDTKFTRNLIRHDMMPVVNEVNPGFRKVVKRKLEQKLKQEGFLL
jgi:tRNA(Ile)-lysidine synthase